MNATLNDLTYGIRVLRRSPGYTLTVMLSLALGIGLNTIVFSIVNATLLNPLPYDELDRIAVIWGKNFQQPAKRLLTSSGDYLDFNRSNKTFDHLAVYDNEGFNLTGGSEPEWVQGAQVSASFFAVLGVRTVYGRTFLRDEDKPGANRVVVMSHGLWQRRFGGNPDIVGRTIQLNNISYQVVGILSPDFSFSLPLSSGAVAPSLEPHIIVPLIEDASQDARRNDWLTLLGLIKKEVSFADAERDLNVISKQLGEQLPETNRDRGVSVMSLREASTGSIRVSMMVLFGAVAFVLLIACVNVANMLLARAVTRQSEVSVRIALGASRRLILRQFLLESMMLALGGGILGLFLALWGLSLVINSLPHDAPVVGLEKIKVDYVVMSFTFVISILTGLLFGSIPVLQSAKFNPSDSLKEGSGRMTISLRRGRLLGTLVIAEVALAFVLFVGASLLAVSFWRVQQVDLGFDSKNTLVMSLFLSPAEYALPGQRIDFFKQVLDRVQAIPGVVSAGIASELPLTGYVRRSRFTVQNNSQVASQPLSADNQSVSPAYFRAMGIPIIAGRVFDDGDVADRILVVVVNEALAKAVWPGENPIGKRIRLGGPNSSNPWLTVVGVVHDLRHRKVDENPQPGLFTPYAQNANPSYGLEVVVRTQHNPLKLALNVKTAIAQVDPDQPPYNLTTLEHLVSRGMSQRRFNALLLIVLALTALVLAAVGIFSVISYTVAQRTHEFCLRLAFGAQKIDVFWLVLRRGLALALTGEAIGIAGSFALMRLITPLTFGVQVVNAPTFVITCIVLAAITILACYMPARRATQIEPAHILRG